MLKKLQRFLLLILLIFGVLFLLYQGFLYSLQREKFPTGMTIAGVDVAGLTREEAATRLTEQFSAPIFLYHQEDRVPVNPQDVGFMMDLETMLAEAEAAKGDTSFEQGFAEFVLQRPFDPVNIKLIAGHDGEALAAQVQNVADFLDKPASAPQLMVGAGIYEPGQPGYVTDIEASLPAAEMALYQPDPGDRTAQLVLVDQDPIPLNMDVLESQLRRELQKAEDQGMVGSVFIMDLQTGEELSINGDYALSGLSILKIAIFEEAYRVLDGPPNDYVKGLFYDTAVKSSNFGANLLLHVIAGEENTYEGAAVLTESMQRLGLVNTFMAIPYDAVEVSTRPSTYTTPANSRPDSPFVVDTARQTTAEDIGTLLSMIYYCAKGGGALLAVYPGEITPEECQAIIDLMAQNIEGNLIRLGVPEDVTVSHKHGWGDNLTHGDAGIVFSPGGDYVIVTYLHQPTGFIVSEYSFPILWELSRLTYNYFNFENPYMEDAQVRAQREAEAREARLAVEEAEAAGEDAAPSADGAGQTESNTEQSP
ncbi:MAG: serine hydrolase [Chloroflexi bacterium]|nr:serine hydrolase [Chloroflexota bacterium]